MVWMLLVFLTISGTSLSLDTNKIDVKISYNEYCDICEDHTLCKFEGIGPSCEGSVDGGVTAEERQYILDTHNRYRSIVANGFELRGVNGSQPEAANMMQLKWDDELAKVAQHWADQCLFQHDTCRHDRRFKVGQNIYWNWRFPITRTVNWTAAIASWYDEVDKFDSSTTSAYEFNPETGHFTQLMWHDSTLMGCGRRSYGPNKVYVCNYGPTGNWLGEPMYQIGKSCSMCPRGMACTNGLCSESGLADVYNPLHGANAEQPEINAEQQITIETTTTEIPIRLNLIEDLVIPDDEEIRVEIEDLRKRIRLLLEKITQITSQKSLTPTAV